MHGYFLARSKDGHLVLRRLELHPKLGPRSQQLPVNPDYLELLSEEHGIRVQPARVFLLSDLSIVRDALDEALAAVGHDLRSAEGLKRQLLAFHLGLETPTGETDRENPRAVSNDSTTAA